MRPTGTKNLIRAIDDWCSVLEAGQRLALQLLGTVALIYRVIQAILR